MSESQIQVTLIDHMGNDDSIASAARVSFGKSASHYTKEQNSKLLSYLAKHKHMSPFGHVFLSFHIKAPIFVRAQLVKHKFIRTNEISRRYVDTDIEFYQPDVWRIKPKGSVKQGSGTEVLPKPDLKEGFCRNCGVGIAQVIRPQGGGQARVYCSDTCKFECGNKHRNPYKSVFNNAKARVKREGKKEWDLCFDTFLFPEYCPYLGLKLDYSRGKKEIQPNSPSFDCIDPSKGYVEGNVEIISNRANSMKNDADVETQVAMAKQVLLMHKGYVVQDDKTYEGYCNSQLKLYEAMIKDGYSAEMARMVLPQSLMTEWYWSGSLDAFTDMCKLRIKEDTQYESQVVANQVYQLMKGVFPVAAPLLVEGFVDVN